MSHAEVAARGVFHAYRVQCDEMAKWCRVPNWQAEAGIEQARAEAEKLRQVGLLPMARSDVQGAPADLRHAYSAATRLQRHLAGLRCVEAIRLYAASHYEAPQRADEAAGRTVPVNPFTGTYDARLPLAWDDITEVPLPVNPFTGKPFPVRRESNAIVLDLDGHFFNRRWWIRLAE
jgi:hypothetical protein